MTGHWRDRRRLVQGWMYGEVQMYSFSWLVYAAWMCFRVPEGGRRHFRSFQNGEGVIIVLFLGN